MNWIENIKKAWHDFRDDSNLFPSDKETGGRGYIRGDWYCIHCGKVLNMDKCNNCGKDLKMDTATEKGTGAYCLYLVKNEDETEKMDGSEAVHVCQICKDGLKQKYGVPDEKKEVKL